MTNTATDDVPGVSTDFDHILSQVLLRMKDRGLRQIVTEIISGSSEDVDLSGILKSILELRDARVDQLVGLAAPAGCGVSDLLSRIADERSSAYESSSGKLSRAAILAVRDYHGLRCAGDEDSELLSFLQCVLRRTDSAQRDKWRPLNIELMAAYCAREIELGRAVDSNERETNSEDSLRYLGALECSNLTEFAARSGPAVPSPFLNEPAYARVFDSLCRALHRSVPRHVLLVRERGVGDQAVLMELARRGREGKPAFLRDRQFLLVNCRNVPVDEVRPAIESLFGGSALPATAVLCLDGFANLLRLRGPSDNRSFLLSALARISFRIIGIVTPHEYEELLTSDSELREQFTGVHLFEPDIGMAGELARHFVAGLKAQYQLEIDDEAITRAVLLSSSHILHDRLPSKAVKLLRDICDDVDYDRTQNGAARHRIGERDVVAKVAQLSGIPEATLEGTGEGVDYRKSLGELIVGQDHAVGEVATELGLIKAGLIDGGKPASVMMFIGQTGTGKTEMAKALARFYSSSKRLKTFTLGNFSEPHSVSGIIGVPPGYVGHELGGRLVNELNADPYGVFLLDEADKAHPDVMQPFLNLFDEGWICDQRGVKAYADRAIFILTTNVGQRQIADMCKNGKSIREITSTMKDSLSRIRHTKSNRPVFTAEFMARVKRFIVFGSLNGDAMHGICDRLVSEMQKDWLHRRQKSLRIPLPLMHAISREAHSLDEKSQGREGGRIVRKLVADVIESKIQTAISDSPQVYRECRSVSVHYEPAVDGDEKSLRGDAIRVEFSGS